MRLSRAATWERLRRAARSQAVWKPIGRQGSVVAACLAAFVAPASASLLGDTVTARFGASATIPSVVVGAGVELPNAGPTLGLAGPGRFDIDFDAASIRIDFTVLADYGAGASFTFGSLDPVVGNANCIVSSVTAASNQNPATYDPTVQLTFGAHEITIGFGPPSAGALRWNPGDFIVLDLEFACPVPVQESTWGGVKHLFRDATR